MVTVSPVAFATRSTTFVEEPVHPASTVWGSMTSEKVRVMVSPSSGRPATPAFVVCTLVAVGLVLSTVTVNPLVVPLLPARSLALMVYAFEPATRGLLAVTEALR